MIELLAFLIMTAICFVYSAPEDDFEGEDQ